MSLLVLEGREAKECGYSPITRSPSMQLHPSTCLTTCLSDCSVHLPLSFATHFTHLSSVAPSHACTEVNLRLQRIPWSLGPLQISFVSDASPLGHEGLFVRFLCLVHPKPVVAQGLQCVNICMCLSGAANSLLSHSSHPASVGMSGLNLGPAPSWGAAPVGLSIEEPVYFNHGVEF